MTLGREGEGEGEGRRLQGGRGRRGRGRRGREEGEGEEGGGRREREEGCRTVMGEGRVTRRKKCVCWRAANGMTSKLTALD